MGETRARTYSEDINGGVTVANDRVVSVDNGVETTREDEVSTGLTGWSFARCNGLWSWTQHRT